MPNRSRDLHSTLKLLQVMPPYRVSEIFGESYPQPVQGHPVPYKSTSRQNPRLSGLLLLIASYLVETFGFIRRIVWHKAGFGALRHIQIHIGFTEPRFIPTVYPHDVPNSGPAGHIGNTADGPAMDKVDIPVQANYSVAQYRKLFLSGELTPRAVAEAILPLIRRDISPPGIHSAAWTDIEVDLVLKAAEASTLRYQQKESLGPLDGIPVAVKDPYHIDGYKTTFGSKYDLTENDHLGNVYTSWCVEKLQEAGAIIVGKLNMHELGMDTSGINITYGTPRNPHNKNYYTGGSSSGSAYAVSTGLVPVTLGTDGGGSIRIPASFCSVFGLKPSHGRLSHRPGHNTNSTCEVNGLVAADMGSLATVYSVLSQPHPTSPFPPAPSLYDLLSDTSSRPRVLGIMDAWFDRAEPGVREICRAKIDSLVRNKGYTVVPIEIPFLKEGQAAHALSIISDLATLISDTRRVSPLTRILIALGHETSAADYILAQKLRRLLMEHLAWLWQKHPNMIIVTPTTACAGWPIRSARELDYGLSDADRTLQTMEYVWLANFCGMPSLTIPAGYVVPEGEPGAGQIAEPGTPGGVPVGLMATAEWTMEDMLIRFGCDMEELKDTHQSHPATWVDIRQAARIVHAEDHKA
ncbi:amidase [Xylaria nigripes]|nr:amidase [Xylaria nigripes]